jgi:uncharacterized NAD(P)/FAD-binding protein YdhS
MSAPRTLAIIGAGYSGALTAVQALRQAPPGQLRVALIERRSRFARGLAYHTWDDNLLLNVPAGNMSALAEEPQHFVDYLRGIDPAFGPASFISRRIYGDYLEDTLQAAERAANGQLQRVNGSVRSLNRDTTTGQWRIALVGGPALQADTVVLALGHFAPLDPAAVAGIRGSDAYVANPWDGDAIDRADRTRPIAILGAAHTAIDVLFRLTSAGTAPDVLLISRRGLLAQGHRFAPKAPPPATDIPAFLQGVPPTLRAYTRAIIREARGQEAAGGDWRDTLNSLRPHTPTLWQRLGIAGQRRFLREVVPYWDIHRHRLAPAASRRLEQLLQSGQVRRVAGQLLSAATDGAVTQLRLRPRGAGAAQALAVGTVINCTGPTYDIGLIQEPLIVELRESGLIRPDPLRLGMEVDAGYRVIARDGTATPGLYYVGPMLKARYWEAIAIPELRVHTQRLAQQLRGPPA